MFGQSRYKSTEKRKRLVR